MINAISYCETPLNGVQSYSRSAFMVDDEEELSPFSFRDVLDVFKKKDSGSSSSSSSDSGSNPSREKGSGIGAGILTGVLGLVSVAGALAPVLPQIGIGSKSRIAETNATAAANAQIYNAQTQLVIAERNKEKDKERLYLIIGVGVLLLVLVAGVLFTRR